jgi:putative glutamine amidotransferase
MTRKLVGIPMGVGEDDRSYRLGRVYVQAMELVGGHAVCLPASQAAARHVPELIEVLGGLFLVGRTDIDPVYYDEEPRFDLKRMDPHRDAFEIALCREALRIGLPVLGICRGCQVLNVAAGGTLYQDIEAQPGPALRHSQSAPRWHPTHEIVVTAESQLREILGGDAIRVNSFHHQTIRDVAPGFHGTAHASDGTIEAIEDPEAAFAIGVQWHPEEMVGECEEGTNLLARFVDACVE